MSLIPKIQRCGTDLAAVCWGTLALGKPKTPRRPYHHPLSTDATPSRCASNSIPTA